MRGFWSISDGEWFLHERYIGRSFPVGYTTLNPREWNRVVERHVYFEDELSFKFEVGCRVNLNGEVITVSDVIHELDGSITYHTDKEVQRIVLISEKEARETKGGK
jgi:hypothetical protein